MRTRSTLLIAAALALPAPLAAQHTHGAPSGASSQPATGASALPTPSMTAAPAEGAVRIDGRLDEAAWGAAEPATGFVQQRPNPGAPASERTEVRILYTADAIYVGARMHDAAPDSVAAQLARRDASVYSDWFHVFLDGHRDRRTAFGFSVNPRGVKRDVYRFNDSGEDAGWDAVWDAAAAVDSAGWTAEIRIPLSQLRFARGDGSGGAWGVQLVRDLARRDERSTWSPIPPNYAGFVSRAGELRGLSGLAAPRRLEIQPYASSRVTRQPGSAADPFHRQNALAGAAGADVKVGLTSSLTLTGTVNPDFGQVELDPAQVNLTAFETFLPEQRPFFVEGADVFRFGQVRSYYAYSSPIFFYSRRVGRAPQRRVFAGPGEWVDEPEQSTILAAAKVSGRVGGWSIGLLDAVTAEERARIRTAAGSDSASPVEPAGNHLVARLRRDLRGGRTTVGGVLTATHRDLGAAELDGMLRSRAFVYGVDAEHSWGEREWVLSGYYARSEIAGSASAIASAQRSSARYFARPDADHVDLDPARTSLSGHIAALAVQNNGPVHASLVYQESSPGWELNDLGFQTRTDWRAVSGHLGRFHDRPGRLFRSYATHLYATSTWNFGGDPIYRDLRLSTFGTFHNLWSAGVDLSWRPATVDDRLTRGGPLAERPGEWQASLYTSTDPRRRVSLSAHQIFTGGMARRQREHYLGIDWRPSSSLQLVLSPQYLRTRAADQFVTATADPTATATYGARYVFADLERTEAALGTRVNWTFSPTLSLLLYARPFVSANGMGGFKELAAPRSFAFDRYGEERGTVARLQGAEACAAAYRGRATAESVCWEVDPDGEGTAAKFAFPEPAFTLASLRGSAVVRWEYRPGSTLFFVWQQQRSGTEAFDGFDAGRDARGIFEEPAHNVFLVKATYWIGG